MIRVDLFGGFGEKGRTSVGIATQTTSIVCDVGIKVGAVGREYYPAIDDDQISRVDALFISHAHEDHIGGLSWLQSRGFRGQVYMTAETLSEAPAMLEQYAGNGSGRSFPVNLQGIRTFFAGDEIDVGDIRIATGRSGHVPGGVWFGAEAGGSNVVYTADVVPESNVLAMDAISRCDLLVLDASYGADPISGNERSQAIRDWIGNRQAGCLLPIPLSGKPLELMAILQGRFAIHASMREPIAAQIAASDAFLPGIAPVLQACLNRALDWREEAPFPDCPLLTYDGMGSAGPSVRAICRAAEQNLPILLTGHIPPNTPASRLFSAKRAEWIRLPTHPTRVGSVAIWESAGRPPVLGHSCVVETLKELKTYLPKLDVTAKSGQRRIV
ncbi:MBL fold metallo-hydrolase [Phyllobacterium pellucidum]|uniref:MBL fold metallo-hydrolase n=1 Tax=Phyllobacterium pellucidum TaxID=2740464 RepID=UPI0031B63DB1